MHKIYLKTAAFFGALAVISGAFGAHYLKEMLSVSQLQTFETSVRYQFYHVFALLITSILYKEFPGKGLQWAGRFFITGIILFCGSLYVLSCVHSNPVVWIGAVTPLGGICFIAGWVLLGMAIIEKQYPEKSGK